MARDLSLDTLRAGFAQETGLSIEQHLKEGNVLSAVSVAAASLTEAPKMAKLLPQELWEKLARYVGKYAWDLALEECLYSAKPYALEYLVSLKETYAPIGSFDAVVKAHGDKKNLREENTNAIARVGRQLLTARVYWDSAPDKDFLDKIAYRKSIDKLSPHKLIVAWPKRWDTYNALNRIKTVTKVIGIETAFDHPDVTAAFMERMDRLEKYPDLLAADLRMMEYLASGHPLLSEKVQSSAALKSTQDQVISQFPIGLEDRTCFLTKTKDGLSFYREAEMGTLIEMIQSCADHLRAEPFPVFLKLRDIIALTVKAADRRWPVRNQLSFAYGLLDFFPTDLQISQSALFTELRESIKQRLPEKTLEATKQEMLGRTPAPESPGKGWISRITSRFLRKGQDRS